MMGKNGSPKKNMHAYRTGRRIFEAEIARLESIIVVAQKSRLEPRYEVFMRGICILAGTNKAAIRSGRYFVKPEISSLIVQIYPICCAFIRQRFGLSLVMETVSAATARGC